MKILHVISQRPDSTGSGTYLQEIVRQCNLNGYDNGIVAASQLHQDVFPQHIRKQDYFPVVFNKEIPFDIVGMSDTMPYPSRTFQSLTQPELACYIATFSDAIKNAVKTFKPDLIHTHHLWLLTSLTKQLFPQIPVVTTCHGTDLRQFINCPQYKKYVLEGCSALNQVMALSLEQKEEIHQLYAIDKNRIKVVGGGYNVDLFNGTKKIKKNSEDIKLIYAGKIATYKGVPYLLKCLQKLLHLPYHFDLVGSSTGKENEYCMELAKKLGNKVTIHGALKQEEVAQLMKNADYFILPSFFEGLPLVTLEALACGCHVLTTDLPGIREILFRTTSHRITAIPLPELINVDTPTEKGRQIFTDNLEAALKTIIYTKAPTTDSGDILYFSWPRVYDRVNHCYSKALSIE